MRVIKNQQWIDGDVHSVAGLTQFYIDSHGNKHLKQNDDSWQPLTCVINDDLVKHGDVWIVKNPLQHHYDRKLITINNACSAAITAGFESNALGTTHRYSSDLEDQLNISGNIQLGVDTVHICYDEQGLRDFRLHTATQMRQVGVDFAAHKLTCLQKANTLKEQALAALTASDSEALSQIAWSLD